jgi:hypothetical protein
VQAERADLLVQRAHNAEELIVGGLDVLGEERLDVRIVGPRREPAEDKVALDAVDRDPAEVAAAGIPQGNELSGVQGHG